MPEKPPVVTHHAMTVNGGAIRYTAITGQMPIRNERTGVTTCARSPGLERAFAKNPAMRQHISIDQLVAGHMMYIDAPSTKKLRADLSRFSRMHSGWRVRPPRSPA